MRPTNAAIITSHVGDVEMKPHAVLELLGGRKSFHGKFETTLDLVDLGKKD